MHKFLGFLVVAVVVVGGGLYIYTNNQSVNHLNVTAAVVNAGQTVSVDTSNNSVKISWPKAPGAPAKSWIIIGSDLSDLSKIPPAWMTAVDSGVSSVTYKNFDGFWPINGSHGPLNYTPGDKFQVIFQNSITGYSSPTSFTVPGITMTGATSAVTLPVGTCPQSSTPTICNVKYYKYKSTSGTSAGEYGLFITWDSSPGINGAYVFTSNGDNGKTGVLGHSKSNSFLWLPSVGRKGVYTIYVANIAQLATPATGGPIAVHTPVPAGANYSIITSMPDVKTLVASGQRIKVGGVHDGTVNDNSDDSSWFGDVFGGLFAANAVSGGLLP